MTIPRLTGCPAGCGYLHTCGVDEPVDDRALYLSYTAYMLGLGCNHDAEDCLGREGWA
jgi:hypothetical protein